ncbi:MAG: dTMP kinase [Candidatus Bathyarchaeota archaeon]
MEKKGFFVCVEGLDGCGKTTQTKSLVERLRQKGYDAIYTSEPTHGDIGVFIRKHCLHGGKRLPSVVEALLFAADRFEHIERIVAPCLDRGCLVISDRYVYSSLAYQGATGLNLSWIEKINEYVISPDLAIFIDVEPETAIQRLKVDRSVMENLGTQRKVREVYLKFVEKDELVKIDGNRTRQKVADDILKVALKFLA